MASQPRRGGARKGTRRPPRKGLPITPHKGGRSELMSAWRATPEARAKLETMMSVWDMSYADALNFFLSRAVVVPLVKAE